MNLNFFKIICIDKDDQISKIIKGVFNSVPYSLKCVNSPEEIISRPSNYSFDLIVVNWVICNCTVEDIKKISLRFSDPSIIIVDDRPENIENWTGFDNLKFLILSELNSRLPIFLGDFYSKDQSKFESSFNFLELLKNALYFVSNLILITDIKSNIIFMNQEAEKIFQLQNQEFGEIQIIDYMIDGAKVWNYITTQSAANYSQKFQVIFTDGMGNEYEKDISVYKLSTTEDFFMLESAEFSTLSLTRNAEKDSAVLNKFADSIANELINPVNNISGRIQLLQSDLGTNAKYKKSLDTLENQVDRINETMSKLLTFARLKQDTIPQKIDLNDLFLKMLMDPSMNRLLERNVTGFDYQLGKDLPLLSGLISHFSLLLKTALEICFECLGNKGRILVETKQLNDYLKQYWILINFNIDYADSLIYKKGCLQDHFKHSNFESNNVSIESTIIDHVIQHYQGLCQIDTETQNREIVKLLFPLSKSKNVLEDK